MVYVTFYFGTTGVQKVEWDVDKYKITNPYKLAKEWAADLGATSVSMSKSHM